MKWNRIVALLVPALFCSARAHAQTAEHRWAGIVFDSFAFDTGQGIEAWTVEDGGRIRHRNPTGVWSFQSVPPDVKDTLHRVTFLTSGPEAGKTGWAVGQGGWVLKTTNGGASWQTIGNRIPTVYFTAEDPYEELYDIQFINASDGWMVGRHKVLRTFNGGVDWDPVDIVDPGPPVTTFSLVADYIEVYALDVVEFSNQSRLGLAVMQPGIVIQSYASGPSDPNYDLTSWKVVWDIRDLCNGQGYEPCLSAGVLPTCMCEICGLAADHGPWFEPWDIEISRNEGTGMELALLDGGLGFQCGMIFASTDKGLTWNKEWHECQCVGAGCHVGPCDLDPLYTDDPTQEDLNRHTDFKTLYGLGILDADNSAIAAGYNGQLLVRDPLHGVWQDRSIFSPNVPTSPGCVKYPMSGAEALVGTGGGVNGIVTGMGGHILETSNGGQTYDLSKAVGDPHRTKSVYFKDFVTGWQGGQFFRIGRSTDEGKSWEEQVPKANSALGQCWAIAFAPDGQHGVAVGDPFTDPVYEFIRPKIRYTFNGGQTPWQENVTLNVNSAYLDNALKEVTWVTTDTFWAAGTGGLIVHSVNSGQSWRQDLPPNAAGIYHELFDIEGLAFPDASNGIFVGLKETPPPTGPVLGNAYHYAVGPPVAWNPVALPSLPTGQLITGLYDVDWDSGSGYAWAVGEKYTGGIREGIVLRSSWNGSSFATFEEINAGGFPRCVTGDELGESPVLTEVEVAPVTGDVWVGGMCGRVWVRRASSGLWIEIQSQTSAHVTDISFTLDAQGQPVGYVNGFRTGPLQQCMVRVRG